jgi:ribosomal protein S18 acetylase RimI-like enzyme
MQLMITLRPARWPDDVRLLAGLDTSFTTDRIYDVVREPFGFALVERRVDPPLRKDYGPVSGLDPSSPELEYAVVAEAEGEAVGFAAAQYEAWSRRMLLWHVYVAPQWQGRGVGRALIQEIETLARSAGARCLRTETQNTNHPAIRFYQRIGFRLCGLDVSLYDPPTTDTGEVAVFLAREMDG